MEILSLIDTFSLFLMVFAPPLLSFYIVFKDANQFIAYGLLLFTTVISIFALQFFFIPVEASVGLWFLMMFVNLKISKRFKTKTKVL